MVDAARQEWLSTLRVNSRVVVKTQIKSYDGVIERIDDDKIWVMCPIGQYGSSVINVNSNTGENCKARMSIFPFID